MSSLLSVRLRPYPLPPVLELEELDILLEPLTLGGGEALRSSVESGDLLDHVGGWVGEVGQAKEIVDATVGPAR